MFPVLDVNGNAIAFGARAMGSDEPKYLNSPETPAYTKGDHLYGLFQSKNDIRQKKFAILVEGYLDLIARYQFGVTNVAASLGTAFTDQQARLLHRFTDRVVINYDGDSAGIKAARRAIEHLLPQEFDIKVLVLPDGKDPDDFIRENGAEVYNERHGKATGFLRFALDASIKDRNLHNAKQKADAIEDFLPVISSIRNNIQRRESFDQAMTFFHIEDGGLRRELWNSLKNIEHGHTPNITQKVSRAARAKITVAERRLLGLLIFDRDLRNIVLPLLEPSDYEYLATSRLFDALIEAYIEDRDVHREELFKQIDEDDEPLQSLMIELLEGKPYREKDEALDEAFHKAEDDVIALRRMAIDNRILEISREMALAEVAGDLESLKSLIDERFSLERSHVALRREINT